jgi:hypothetical protein
VALQQENVLIHRLLRLFCQLLAATSLLAQPRVDNVLVRMVPSGSTSLVGARMNEIRESAFYRELVQQQKLPQVDQFARETGFDPRRDVRELLFATTKSGGVLLARGTFRIAPFRIAPGIGAANNGKAVRHGVYTVWTYQTSGFCILDSTLAVAGDVPSVNAALDEWTSGAHTAAQPLLAHVKQVDPKAPFWGVSLGLAGFLADNIPRGTGGLDFSKIFRGLEDTWFGASFTSGFEATVHGITATEQDAVSLRDTAKGLIGFGRLSVPPDQPEMLKLWDGITVDQDGRAVTVRADIPQNLVDRLIRLLNTAPGGRAGGRRTIP